MNLFLFLFSAPRLLHGAVWIVSFHNRSRSAACCAAS
jgi:hypothetical protein